MPKDKKIKPKKNKPKGGSSGGPVKMADAEVLIRLLPYKTRAHKKGSEFAEGLPLELEEESMQKVVAALQTVGPLNMRHGRRRQFSFKPDDVGMNDFGVTLSGTLSELDVVEDSPMPRGEIREEPNHVEPVRTPAQPPSVAPEA